MSPRYYPITIWLSVLVAWRVWRHFRPGRPKGTGWRVTGWVAVGLVTFLAFSPILVFPRYTPIDPTGDFDVATSVRTVEGITFELWYPSVSDQTFPLVVFSHGSMGIRESNLSMYRDLASHGYVVAALDHPGHALFSVDVDRRRTWIDRGYLGELRRENASEDPVQSLDYYRSWMGARVGDIEFLLDHILENRHSDSVFGLVDPERIGLIGHSLGGSAVLGVGRIRDDVSAVIALEAPYMTEIVGVEAGRFVWNPDPYPVPVLHVYTDSAWGHLEEWPQYRKNAEMLTDPNAENIHIEGVGHLHLTDLSLSSPFLTRVLNGHQSTGDPRETLEFLNRRVLEFLNVHLKCKGVSCNA